MLSGGVEKGEQENLLKEKSFQVIGEYLVDSKQ